MDLKHHRREYKRAILIENLLPELPFPLFNQWLQEALKEEKHDPTAMVLSTAGKDNIPSARMVLLKESSERGLVFFTNYLSHKGIDMEQNPHVSLLFFWPSLERQVRIEGIVQKIPAIESDAYFVSRPEESQIAVWASQQSTRIPDRKVLEERYREFFEKFKGKTKPRPPYWGGYLVVPYRYEFWQGRENRLHDRIEYRLSDNRWTRGRLAP